MQVTLNINVSAPSVPGSAVVALGVGVYQGDTEVTWAKPAIASPVTTVQMELPVGTYTWKARALDADDNQIGALIEGASFVVQELQPVPTGGSVVVG